MSRFKFSPANINYVIICLIFAPRIFSQAIYEYGTILILLFWISPLVLLTEMTTEQWNNKIQLIKFPKASYLVLTISLLVIIASFFWRDLIYDHKKNHFQIIKRLIYLISPLVLIGWFPFVKHCMKIRFILTYATLTISFFLCLTIPQIMENRIVGKFLNTSTSHISSILIDLFSTYDVIADKNYIYISDRTIKVGGGCSSTPQIFICLFASLVFYLCCKIKSKIYLLIILLVLMVTAFLLNCVRISVLSHFVVIQNLNRFNFWHDGAGSLIFSFIVMFITSFSYYHFWSKENPITK